MFIKTKFRTFCCGSISDPESGSIFDVFKLQEFFILYDNNNKYFQTHFRAQSMAEFSMNYFELMKIKMVIFFRAK